MAIANSEGMDSNNEKIRHLKDQASKSLRDGQIADAHRAYEEIARHDTSDPNNWLTLGVLNAQLSQLDKAEDCFRQACNIAPHSAEIHYNIGLICQLQGKPEQAEKGYRAALQIDPQHIDALNGLGSVLFTLGSTPEAIACLQQLISFKPDSAKAHYNLGLAYHKLEDYDRAIEHYERTISLQPDGTDAYTNLGTVYQHKRDIENAISCFKKALNIAPHNPGLHNNLGVALEKQGNTEDAVLHYREAITMQPDNVEAQLNLGSLLLSQNCPDEAQVCFKHVLGLQPNHAEALFNLGRIYQEQCDYEQASACYRQAIEIKPDFAQAHYNLGFTCLRLGDLTQGWPELEWGFRTGDRIQRDFALPEWDGAHRPHQSILVHAEQGIGDEIMFASCLPDLIAVSGSCVIECDTRLAPLFKRSFPSAHVCGAARDQDITPYLRQHDLDAQISIGSLPKYLRRSEDSFPAQRQYLSADQNLKRKWQFRLEALNNDVKVGVSWRGGATDVRKSKRSIELEQWGPILNVPGTSFINLQYDKCYNEVVSTTQKFGTHIFDWDEISPLQDLEEFAALISCLDLVISVDNSTVHLAGSLGVTTWVLLPQSADWRWQVNREDTPWYPSLRLFRQQSTGQWQDTLGHIAQLLSQYARGG